MTIFRAAAVPQTLALVLAVLFASACGGPTPADKTANKSGPSSTPSSAMSESDDDADEGGLGSGTLTFTLPPNAPLILPVTFCAGHGTILTVVGKQGESQVDVRVPEMPGKRDRASLIERTEAGYRFNGSDQGRTFMELWQSQSIDDVVRDGDTTRVSGKMYGLRTYDNGDGTGSTPESIDDKVGRDFSIEVTCSGP